MSQAEASRPRPSVLAVDGSPLVRRVLSDFLGGAGYDVTTTTDLAGVRRALAAGSPRVVITALHLEGEPHGGGLEVIRECRHRDPALAVVLLTCDMDPQVLRAARDAGARAILFKHLGLARLSAVLAEVLAGCTMA